MCVCVRVCVLQGIGLCNCEDWLEKFKVYRVDFKKGRREQVITRGHQLKLLSTGSQEERP